MISNQVENGPVDNVNTVNFKKESRKPEIPINKA